MNLDIFNNFVNKIKEEKRYRNFFEITRLSETWPIVKHKGMDITVFCGTDYLSMSVHPVVIKAAEDVLKIHGIGSGGTRNIAGTYDYIIELEKSLANLHNKEAGLVFSSGYLSNFAAISAFGKIFNRELIIFSDELNHASIIEGIRGSGCQKIIFKHNDTQHLEELISHFSIKTPKLIIFESVYSMDGTIANIGEIVRIAQKYNCLTYVDEVHAVGVYGSRGEGVCGLLDLAENIDLIQGSLSKGFGVIGGYITGRSAVIDAIKSCSSGFIFTSTMPIPVTAACLASVNYLKNSVIERQNHWMNVKNLLNIFQSKNIQLISQESNIMSVLVSGAEKAFKVSEYLLHNYNIYIQHINFPTVKYGEERLRITTNPHHTQSMINNLAEALYEALKKFDVNNQKLSTSYDDYTLQIQRKISNDCLESYRY